MNTLVFDVETVPDTALGRRLHGLHDLSDQQVAQIMFTKRRQETGSEFLSHEQQRIVAISVAMRSRDALKLWSIGDESTFELMTRFYRRLLAGDPGVEAFCKVQREFLGDTNLRHPFFWSGFVLFGDFDATNWREIRSTQTLTVARAPA